MNKLFLDNQNPISLRWAILEDDDKSAWLYLTEPRTEHPIADVFVYNRIKPIKTKDVKKIYGGPPPIDEAHANNQSVISKPETHHFSFAWSSDGNSIAVIKEGNPITMIINAEKHGYSKGIGVNGPWGHVWDEVLYQRVFA